jgi:predicted nucleic acid-binding protein
MAVVGPVFLDTTVLVAGLIDLTPTGEGGAAHRVMDAVAAGRVPRGQTAWHCCLEFYSVATRLPEEYRLTPADARVLLEEEILARLEVVALPPERRLPFLEECGGNGVTGGRVYDVHIAWTALAAGARVIVTENRRHFGPVACHGVQVLTSRELADALA